jgi:hypothetical protein
MKVEVARDRKNLSQEYSRGEARPAKLAKAGAVEPPRHDGALPSRPEIFGKARRFKPATLYQHGALEGLSLPRRRDPLVVRSRR